MHSRYKYQNRCWWWTNRDTWSSGPGLQGLVFRVWSSGSGPQGLVLRVWSSGSGPQGLVFRVWSSGSGLQGDGPSQRDKPESYSNAVRANTYVTLVQFNLIKKITFLWFRSVCSRETHWACWLQITLTLRWLFSDPWGWLTCGQRARL